MTRPNGLVSLEVFLSVTIAIVIVVYYLSLWKADAIGPPDTCDIIMNSSSSRPKINVTSVSIISGAINTSPQDADPVSGFDPSVVKVKVNTTVTWTNYDESVHTVTSGRPRSNDTGQLFISGAIEPNGTFQYTFDSPGEVDYFDDQNNCNWGTVIVEPEGGRNTTTITSTNATTTVRGTIN